MSPGQKTENEPHGHTFSLQGGTKYFMDVLP